MKPRIRKIIKWALFVFVLVVSGLATAIYSMSGVSSPVPPYRKVEGDMKSLDSALAMYKLNAGIYPTTVQGLQSLHAKPPFGPPPRRWSRIMDKLPADPWGRPYIYRFPSNRDPSMPEIFSTGPDGRPDTRDDLPERKSTP